MEDGREGGRGVKTRGRPRAGSMQKLPLKDAHAVNEDRLDGGSGG